MLIYRNGRVKTKVQRERAKSQQQYKTKKQGRIKASGGRDERHEEARNQDFAKERGAWTQGKNCLRFTADTGLEAKPLAPQSNFCDFAEKLVIFTAIWMFRSFV